MRLRRRLPLLAALAIILPTTISAELLVYEPFDYPTDDILTGNGGALGTTGEWYSHDTINDGGVSKTQDWFVHEEGETSGVGLSGANNSVEPSGMHPWDGTVANLLTAGGYVGLWGADDWLDPDGPNTGEPGRNLDANIGLDPGVTESFESGTTTWFSYVAVRGWDRNEETPSLILCTDPTPDESRGASLTQNGSGIGTGGGPPRNNRPHIYPMYFQGGTPHNLFGAIPGWQEDAFTVPDEGRMDWQELDAEGFFGPVNIVVGKIEWDAGDDGEDIISVARFLETDELTEDAFDELIDARPDLSSANWLENQPDLDQSQFDVLNIAGLKFFVDEIRIATTFAEVVPSPDGSPPEVCDNGVDDDEDGRADCDDEDCADATSCQGARFVRGDVDASGTINLSDGISLLLFQFQGGPEPACADAADTDDSGAFNLTDAIVIFQWLFLGGNPPSEPSPSAGEYIGEDCSLDASDDGFDCAVESPICGPAQ